MTELEKVLKLRPKRDEIPEGAFTATEYGNSVGMLRDSARNELAKLIAEGLVSTGLHRGPKGIERRYWIRTK